MYYINHIVPQVSVGIQWKKPPSPTTPTRIISHGITQRWYGSYCHGTQYHITFFSLPIQYSPKNVIFFLDFPISSSSLLLLQTVCYLSLHFSWIWLLTILAACPYNQTMLLSLLTTITKTGAANSSTTLVSSCKESLSEIRRQPERYPSW